MDHVLCIGTVTFCLFLGQAAALCEDDPKFDCGYLNSALEICTKNTDMEIVQKFCPKTCNICQDVEMEISDIKDQLVGLDSKVKEKVSELQNQVGGLTDQLKEKEAAMQTQVDGLMKQLQEKDEEIASKVTGLTEQLKEKDAEIQLLHDNDDHGSTYTRWGRTSCPANSSSMVYKGYMAGASHNKEDRDADYLCLPDDPTWSYYSNGSDNKLRLTSVEYHFWPHSSENRNTIKNFFGSDVFLHNAPCAVCLAPRSANVMFPGRNQCYPGWTLEYHGYLATGRQDWADSGNYVCIDQRPEVIPGTEKRDGNRNVLQLVEADCNFGLPCPPYIEGAEIACAVCSK